MCLGLEEEKVKKKITDPKVGLIKAQKFCAYQERYQQEVRNKLYEMGLWKDDVENIITELIAENFLNEERFAKSFARGKFRIKQWGRVKIKVELKRKYISDYCIKSALKEINEDEYLEVLQDVVLKKLHLKRPSIKQTYATAQYAVSRGFESDLVWEVINKALK